MSAFVVRLGGALAIGVLVLVFTGSIVAAEPPWREVGVHSATAKQPTDWGRFIHTICLWNAMLYLGYGDFDKNTGPIAVTSFNPATGAFPNEWTCMTEAISVYRPLIGRLYAPAIDPRGGRPKAAGFAVGTADGQWRDFAVTDRALYVLRKPAVTVQHTTNLATWSDISVAPSNAVSLAVFRGRLYVGTRDAKLYESPGTVPGELAGPAPLR